MRAVLQRVSSASVEVEQKIIGQIGSGFLILLGVGQGDTEEEAQMLADKISQLRVFCDENDKMNLSLLDTAGGALVISNFTLYADCRKGRRPNFTNAAPPEPANALYAYFCSLLRQAGIARVEQGEFGAEMKVSLLNDGPVTILLDTDDLKRARRS